MATGLVCWTGVSADLQLTGQTASLRSLFIVSLLGVSSVFLIALLTVSNSILSQLNSRLYCTSRDFRPD